MKVLHCLISLALALAEVQGLCTVTLLRPAARAGLTCLKPGHLNPANAEEQYIRQIYQHTAAACASICRYNSDCKSLSYVTKTGECHHYLNDLSSFVADATSTRLFSDPACYKRPTTCLVLNGNFEDMTVTTGKGAVKAKPAPGVFVTPWEGGNSLSRLSNQQLGTVAQHTPDRNFFGLVIVNNDGTVVFQQILSLKPNTAYTLKFIYNFINYKGTTGTRDNNYDLKAGYGPRAFLDKRYFSATLDPDDTAHRGVWIPGSFDFVTSDNGEGGLFFGVTATPFSTSAVQGIFGFDAVVVSEAA